MNFSIRATFITVCILASSVFNAYSACDAPAYLEGQARNYAKDDIVSRNGVDYKVIWESWCNNPDQDWAYAPGTGSIWESAWTKVNDPCIDTGQGGGGNTGGGNTGGGDTGGGNTGGGDTGGGSTGGGNGQACSDKNDHGHGTWYVNLEDPNHNLYTGVVRCSFERDDIVGSKYGALDKGLLQESNNAKYCGMCVEATGPAGTAIVQIVDECPDCWDRSSTGQIMQGTNTKFGDIDLSPAAFEAVVGAQSVGIGDFDWKEVTCPWTTPLHIIIEGSHQWYAKVIIGNHTNRVAKVEVSDDGGNSWVEMARGEDNGWVKGSLSSPTKSFRIIDIYGSEVIMNNVDFSTNIAKKKVVASDNFPACGEVSVNNPLNTLDYVSAYPNPASNLVTFDGVTEVQTIEVVNINGQVVASKILGAQYDVTALDISKLSPGIYVAKLTGANTAGTVKFIKK